MLRPLSPLSSGKYKNDLFFFPFLPSPGARITVSRRTKESDFPSRALQLAFSPTTDSPRFSFAHSTPTIISTSPPFLFAAEAAFDFYETCNLRGDKEFSVVALALGAPLSLAISFALRSCAPRNSSCRLGKLESIIGFPLPRDIESIFL